MPDTSDVVFMVLTFALGGGLTALISTVQQNKKVTAEAGDIGAKTQPEIQEITVGTMTEVITNLRADNESVRQERDHYRERLQEVEKRVEFLTGELTKLQDEIAALLSHEADHANS